MNTDFFSIHAGIKMVRETRLELVRHTTHAPQTCLSANSSTRADPLSRSVFISETTLVLYHRHKQFVNCKSRFCLSGLVGKADAEKVGWETVPVFRLCGGEYCHFPAHLIYLRRRNQS